MRKGVLMIFHSVMSHVAIKMSQNGILKQDGNTKNMIFKVSQFYDLQRDVPLSDVPLIDVLLIDVPLIDVPILISEFPDH